MREKSRATLSGSVFAVSPLLRSALLSTACGGVFVVSSAPSGAGSDWLPQAMSTKETMPVAKMLAKCCIDEPMGDVVAELRPGPRHEARRRHTTRLTLSDGNRLY